MTEGRDVFYDEVCEAADPECPAEPMEAEHPLFILYTSGSTAKPEGHPPHHRRLPDRRDHHPPLRLRPEAGDRRLLVRRRRRLDHRPLLHRLRPARQRRDRGHVGGRPRLPPPGHLVGARRRTTGRRSSTPPRPRSAPSSNGAPRSPASTTSPSLRLLGSVGEPINPEGLALVPQGDRRRTVPDRRHLVADGDRRDHDHAAARDHRDQARLGDDRLPRGQRRGRRRVRGRAGRRRPGPAGARAAVALDAPHPLQGGRALRRDLLLKLRQGPLPGRRRRPHATPTATSG